MTQEQKESQAAYDKLKYQRNREQILARVKRYEAANREKIRTRKNDYYKANKETISTHRKTHYKVNKETILARKKTFYHTQHTHHSNALNGQKVRGLNTVIKALQITRDELKQCYIKQNAACAICRTPQRELKKRLAVDHCHKSGMFRGLLCSACNLGLGIFKDNISNLQSAIQYLQTTSNN